ncbi:hypothetical protein OUY22_12280 [Nonomuraea sp. MCN248]|uniref:DUF4386 family protein n=1 Tax=Nonomuraea corallina TaxID=2989783 RepID=A0ABT4SAM0_9ACTN|nr:hypothetical protein [Nonomuraea corallina]MDA0634195.1 hypothetical protein [Nonomuraea corallina]
MNGRLSADHASRTTRGSVPGGVFCAVAGGLHLVKAVLDLVVQEPPAEPSRLPEWVEAHRVALMATNEILAVGAVALIPAVLALYRALRGSDGLGAASGCALLGLTVPVGMLLVVVHGRLVYPAYGIELDDPPTLALVVVLYYGGVHLVALLWGCALLVLAAAMRKAGWGRAAVIVGVVAGLAQLAGSFPWVLGPALVFPLQALLTVWLGLTGWRLARPPAPSPVG